MSVGIVELFEVGASTSRLPFNTIASVLLIFFLLLILIEKEIFRITGADSAKKWMRILDIFLLPCLGAVGFMILFRFIALMN